KADSVDMLKLVAAQLRASGESIILVGGAEIEGKAVLLVMISDDLIREKKLDAARMIREISPEINGSGGGQPFLAIAGGNKPSGIMSALKKARDIIVNL
ncbi:MAG: alanine--tRNA ligase, partial [Bacteroidia bacterium]